MSFLTTRSFFVTRFNQRVVHNVWSRSISSQFSGSPAFQLCKRKVNKCEHLYQRSNHLANVQFSILSQFYSSKSDVEDTGSKEHIDKLVKKNKCVVFMKGVPEQPMCGFSNAVVQILRMHNVDYDAHNVLDDEALRAGIKLFSDWPTIPQIYINGEFIGGCDILLQMHQSGDLINELEKVGIKSALLDEETDPKTQ